MGLFGSLYTSTTGMIAASRATQTVSENVANISTTGYKRSDTSFRDIVASTTRDTDVTGAGGVLTTKLLRTTVQGAVQQTSSTLDASITGHGFFPVASSATEDSDFSYTRNGQFSEFAARSTADSDALTTENAGEQTFLRNSAGFYLYGWPVDADGNVSEGTDTSSLQAIEISAFQTRALATTSIDLSLNIDATETDYSAQRLGQTLPVNNQDLHFSRSVNVYDALGEEHPVTFEYRKITGPMAQFTSDIGSQIGVTDDIIDTSGSTPGILANDTLEITDGTDSFTVTFVSAPADTTLNEVATYRDLISVIESFTDSATGTTQLFDASVTDSGQFLVQSINPATSIDITGSSASVLGSNGFNVPVDPVDGDYAYDPDFDITVAADATSAYPNQGDLPAIADTTNPNTQGWWELTVRIPDPANPTGGSTIVQSQGLVNFDGNGSLNATTDANGDYTITLDDIDFDSATTGDELSLSVDISNTSQLAGGYTVIQADQNGAGIGQRTSVQITDSGIVQAVFSNGITSNIYQIPLAVFANPDGLRAENGTVFSETDESGAVTLTAADSNGAGSINASTLESSNVDLGAEISNLIIYQRSFGLNSQVINAVDEMTQNLAQLKR